MEEKVNRQGILGNFFLTTQAIYLLVPIFALSFLAQFYFFFSFSFSLFPFFFFFFFIFIFLGPLPQCIF